MNVGPASCGRRGSSCMGDSAMRWHGKRLARFHGFTFWVGTLTTRTVGGAGEHHPKTFRDMLLRGWPGPGMQMQR